MGAAFANFFGVRRIGADTCLTVPAPGTLLEAVVSASDVKWAFGRIEAKPGCKAIGANSGTYNANSRYPLIFPYNRGVFEKQRGGSWSLNYVESLPFPCPATRAPGSGNPFVPLAVLNAVGVHYATGCDYAVWPTLR